jgi:hypothetical protein
MESTDSKNDNKNNDTIILVDASDCPICLSELLPTGNETVGLSCKCQFCIHCLKRYAQEQISNGIVNISCPNITCNVFCTNDEIERITESHTFVRFVKLSINTQVATDSTRAWCPTPDCNTICDIMDASSSGGRFKTEKYCKCPKCQFEFSPEEIAKQLTTWKILELNPKTKMCPQCNVLIERNGGCSLVLCRNCLTMVKIDENKIVLSPKVALFLFTIEVVVFMLLIFAYKSSIDSKNWGWSAYFAIILVIMLAAILSQASNYGRALLVYIKMHH